MPKLMQTTKRNGATQYRILLDDGTSRRIGTLNKGIMSITRSRTLHFFVKYNARGFGYDFIEKLFSIDPEIVVRVKETETGRVWDATVAQIVEHSIILNFKSQGFEVQRFMPVDNMSLDVSKSKMKG